MNSNNQNYECVYCGNPSPNVDIASSTKKSLLAGIPQTISADTERSEYIQRPARIFCNLCDKKYELISNQNNQDFIGRLLNNISFAESILYPLMHYEISIGDIQNGFCGLTMPITRWDTITRKKTYNIIFKKNGCTYYVRCKKHKKGGALKIMAISLEEVWSK